jgi:hypothetical protein
VAVTHVWPLITTAIASMKNGMPSAVAAFNAEAGHGVQLVAPDDASYFAGASDALVAESFPAVEVYVAQGSLGPFDIHRAHADIDDRVTVVIWAEGGNGEIPELYEQAVGLGRCTIEVLAQDSAFGPDVEIANQRGALTYSYSIVPADPNNRSIDRWRTAVVLQFMVEDVTPIP